MLWTLLIWVVVGFVMVSVVWPIGVLARAAKNGYDVELYLNGMTSVLVEDDAEMKAEFNKFERIILAVLANVFWPYKIIWFMRELLPRFDEQYVDLVLEKLENGELA